MGIVVLILQIISAIPTLIRVIKEIMDIIHGLKGEEKKAAQQDLTGIIKKHLKNGCKDHACAEHDLHGLAQNLRDKYGIRP